MMFSKTVTLNLVSHHDESMVVRDVEADRLIQILCANKRLASIRFPERYLIPRDPVLLE